MILLLFQMQSWALRSNHSRLFIIKTAWFVIFASNFVSFSDYSEEYVYYAQFIF